MKPRLRPVFCLLALLAVIPAARAENTKYRPLVIPADASSPVTISLAGTWTFQFDPRGRGVNERVFMGRLVDTIPLPGTTEQAQKSPKGAAPDSFVYAGHAWYQREIRIPASWKGKRITLFLEKGRTTTVWVDELEISTEKSGPDGLSFDLSHDLHPGSRRITLLVDNTAADSSPGGTEGNWNGVLGRIELRVAD